MCFGSATIPETRIILRGAFFIKYWISKTARHLGVGSSWTTRGYQVFLTFVAFLLLTNGDQPPTPPDAMRAMDAKRYRLRLTDAFDVPIGASVSDGPMPASICGWYQIAKCEEFYQGNCPLKHIHENWPRTQTEYFQAISRQWNQNEFGAQLPEVVFGVDKEGTTPTIRSNLSSHATRTIDVACVSHSFAIPNAGDVDAQLAPSLDEPSGTVTFRRTADMPGADFIHCVTNTCL